MIISFSVVTPKAVVYTELLKPTAHIICSQRSSSVNITYFVYLPYTECNTVCWSFCFTEKTSGLFNLHYWWPAFLLFSSQIYILSLLPPLPIKLRYQVVSCLSSFMQLSVIHKHWWLCHHNYSRAASYFAYKSIFIAYHFLDIFVGKIRLQRNIASVPSVTSLMQYCLG